MNFRDGAQRDERRRECPLSGAPRRLTRFVALGLLSMALAAPTAADGRKPGSLLVFPVHKSGGATFTALSITNTNLQPPTGITLGGATNVHIEFVNAVPNPAEPFKTLYCQITNRTEHLTAGDTATRVTSCINPGQNMEGYVVAVAEDPLLQPTAWSHNHLVGSEIVINASNAVYSLNAISFRSPQPPRTATDRDGDRQYDLDGIEYEGAPEELIIDSFVADPSTELALISLTGGLDHQPTVRFQFFNDNEFALSSTLSFGCWIEEPLESITLLFNGKFLAQNTPNDPTELDLDCDGIGDLETGWAKIDGLQTSSSAQSIPDPAVIGALTGGDSAVMPVAKLLWESEARQTNGDFFKFGSVDPEFPE